ncbi:MAG: methyltransferase [Terriglobia bacterium]|jgi:protein-S-isoprenylcysteine O-methyltransferase Ste14
MLLTAAPHLSIATGFLRLIDYLALFYLVMLFWIPFYWFVFHAAIRIWRRVGNRAFGVALPVWLIFVTGLFISRHGLFARRLERSPLTWVVGGVLFLVASWLDVQTRHAFGWRRLVGLTELNPQHRLCGVIRTGIYGRVRHPRYLLYMLMILSMAFLTGALTIFLLAFLTILLYQVVAPLEERELLDQYGSHYADYRRSVPRFVPHLGRTPETRISS